MITESRMKLRAERMKGREMESGRGRWEGIGGEILLGRKRSVKGEREEDTVEGEGEGFLVYCPSNMIQTRRSYHQGKTRSKVLCQRQRRDACRA